MSKCCGRIFRSYRFVDCKNNAKVSHLGLDYCGIHDPQAKAAREAKTQARWAAKRVATEARYAANTAARLRAQLCVAACSTLTDFGVSELGRWLSVTPSVSLNLNTATAVSFPEL